MESKDFTCLCNTSIPIEEEENIYFHISECQKYQGISPISQIFAAIPLQKLDFGQLLALKTEYFTYLCIIEENLLESFLFFFFIFFYIFVLFFFFIYLLSFFYLFLIASLFFFLLIFDLKSSL